MTRLPIFQVDAFADRVFAGNPAAVVPLTAWLPDPTMQAIATENNLSQTAFIVPDRDAVGGEGYAIRWFTPLVEDWLCGHATLAAAYVVRRFVAPGDRPIVFATRQSGRLTVTPAGDRLEMDFPAWPAAPETLPSGLAAALGVTPSVYLKTPRDGLAVFADAATVGALKPDFAALKRAVPYSVIVTGAAATGDGDVDFVSRFFAPDVGIDEDPVTGSTHCALIPYWAERLGRARLTARQVSARGGVIEGELRGARVTIAGRARLYLEGHITL